MSNLHEISKFLQSIAPMELSFRGLENRVEIGPQSESEMAKTTINRVLIATYISGRVATKATQDKANLVITHRPLFPFAVDRLTGLDLIRVRLLAKNYISIFTLGSPWIAARDGISDAFVERLELNKLREFMILGDFSEMVPAARVCSTTKTMNHSRFADFVAERMNVENVQFSGDLDKEVEDILVFPGYHIDMPEVILAKKLDIDTIVTGEMSPDIRLLANEEGVNTIEVGPFVTETPGMERLKNVMSLEFPELKIEFFANRQYSQTLKRL